MDRLLSWLCAMILAGGGAWALASSSIAFTVPAPIRWVLPDGMKHFSTPGSQRDAAVKAAADALDAQKACWAQLTTQNASIALLGQKSREALVASEHDLEGSRAVVESLRQNAGKLGVFVPQGSDELSRWKSADAAVVGSLK